MKKITLVLMSLFLILALTGVAKAVSIDFSEVSLGTSDPIIGDVSFWAGDPGASWPNDTWTDDAWYPGNPYLVSGFDDGIGNSPGLYDTFIGISIDPLVDPFQTCTFDIESYLTDLSTTIYALAFSSGSQVASTSQFIDNFYYYSMSLTFATGFDTIHIYDDMNTFGVGDMFNIDNFEYAPVPEPATMFLLFLGLPLVCFLKRKIGS